MKTRRKVARRSAGMMMVVETNHLKERRRLGHTNAKTEERNARLQGRSVKWRMVMRRRMKRMKMVGTQIAVILLQGHWLVHFVHW
jgi:hypothetical protein